MSFAIAVKFKSGSFTGSSKTLKRKIAKIRDAALIEAVNQLESGFVEDNVAKDTGSLRKALIKMLERQIRRKGILARITIKFNALIEESKEEYYQYHVFGVSGEARSPSPYKKPSTPGTRPINERVIMSILRALIKKNLNIGFKKEFGKDYREYGGVVV